MLTARFQKLLHALSQRHAHGAAAQTPPHLHNALDMLRHAPVDLIQVRRLICAHNKKQQRKHPATSYLQSTTLGSLGNSLKVGLAIATPLNSCFSPRRCCCYGYVPCVHVFCSSSSPSTASVMWRGCFLIFSVSLIS